VLQNGLYPEKRAFFYIRMILNIFPDIDNSHFAIQAVDCQLHAIDQKMIASWRGLSSYFRAEVHPLLEYPVNGDLFVGWKIDGVE